MKNYQQHPEYISQLKESYLDQQLKYFDEMIKTSTSDQEIKEIQERKQQYIKSKYPKLIGN